MIRTSLKTVVCVNEDKSNLKFLHGDHEDLPLDPITRFTQEQAATIADHKQNVEPFDVSTAAQLLDHPIKLVQKFRVNLSIKDLSIKVQKFFRMSTKINEKIYCGKISGFDCGKINKGGPGSGLHEISWYKQHLIGRDLDPIEWIFLSDCLRVVTFRI